VRSLVSVAFTSATMFACVIFCSPPPEPSRLRR
jgi:hypothetical protein